MIETTNEPMSVLNKMDCVFEELYKKFPNSCLRPAEQALIEAMRTLAVEVDRVEASIGCKIERINPETLGYEKQQPKPPKAKPAQV
jgi:hypothetical protein